MEPVELEHVIGFSGDEKRVLGFYPRDPDSVLVAMGRNVVVQSLSDDHSQQFLQGHDESVSVIATSRNGTFVASGQQGSRRLSVPEAEIIVWDLSQKVDVYHLKGIRGGVVALAFSLDEMFLSGSGLDGSLYIWDMQTGELVSNMSSGSHLAVSRTLFWGPTQSGRHARRPDYMLYTTVAHEVDLFRLTYNVGSMQYVVEKSPFKLPAGMIREYMDGCLSPCGEFILMSTSVGSVNIYQTGCLTYRASFPLCSGGALSLCAVGQFVFVGGGDGTVKRLMGSGADWRLDADAFVTGSVTSLSGFLDTGNNKIQLLVGTDAGRMYVLDGEKMSVMREIHNETAPLVAVTFKPKNSVRFATLNERGVARVWDLSDYSVVASSRDSSKSGSSDRGLALCFDEFADEVLVGLESGVVRAYIARRGNNAGSAAWDIVRAHRDGVTSVSTTRLFYATGGGKGGVRLWSRQSKTQLFEFSVHINYAVMGLVPDVTQPHLLHSCGTDRSVFTFDLKKEKTMVHHQWNEDGTFTSLTQRLDSEQELITAGTDGRLLTWDYDVDEPVSQVIAHGVGFTYVQVSPLTGKYVAASSTDSRVRVWDLRSGQLVATCPSNGFSSITALAWSPDEKQIVCVGSDKCTSVWNFYHVDVEGDNYDESKK